MATKTTQSSLTTIEPHQQIQAVCLRLLARREHSQRELLDKLLLRGFAHAEVMAVIEQLAGQNWQNEMRFAEAYVRQRIARGYGPVRIAYELQQRGIKGFDIDAQAQEQVDGWQSLALDVYLGRYDSISSLTQGEWLKRSRFLQQRGFSAEMIRWVFAELKIKLIRRASVSRAAD